MHEENATGIEPDHTEAYSDPGLVYHHTGRYREALDEFKTAVSPAPDILQYHIYLAGVYERNDR
jgi:tetratricopeptide (TPR) repeat protein